MNPTRREALRIIANVVPAAAVPGLGTAAQHEHGSAAVAPPPYVPKFFSAAEMKIIDALTETIIPADGHSGGARAARVAEYVDVIASANPDVQRYWRDGLAALEELCRRKHSRGFAECGPDQQTALLEKLSAKEDAPSSPIEKFFVRAKKATVDGYYTSAIGIHDELEYQGNTVVINFEGCTHDHDRRAGIP